jgi:hypothetical protein
MLWENDIEVMELETEKSKEFYEYKVSKSLWKTI